MSDPRYAPRRFARHPEAFGRFPKIDWANHNNLKAPAIDYFWASIEQHAWAVAIREDIKRREPRSRTIAWFADEYGVSAVRLRKVLRGELVIRLEDIEAARRVLSPGITPRAQELSNRIRASLGDG